MSPVRTTLKGETCGVFAMDGGRTTGLAVGTVTLEGSTEEIFKRDPLAVYQIDCMDHMVHESRAEVKGSQEIAQEWLEMSAEWTIDGIPSTRQFFIYEDFIINRNPKSWQREGLAPAAVNHLVMGMLVKYPVVWVPQLPSHAMTRWTNDRLRRAGLWTVGQEHGRDATRHAALWVAQQMT